MVDLFVWFKHKDTRTAHLGSSVAPMLKITLIFTLKMNITCVCVCVCVHACVNLFYKYH